MEEIISRTRTFRKFDSSKQIETTVLEEIINLARLGGSARNAQPWQFLPVNTKSLCDKLFPHLGWAGYLTDWKGPSTTERPVAYILCYLNKQWLIGTEKEAYFDLGIASQNMLLGATERGIGGCRIASFSKNVSALFNLPEHLELQLVIALGYPTEKVVIKDCSQGDIKYWRNDEDIHFVPKRTLSDILLVK